MTTSTITATKSSGLAGIGYMLVATCLFGTTSAIGKWLVAKYPVGEFLFLRAAMTLVLLAPFVWRVGRATFVKTPRPGLQLVRIALSSAEVTMFFWAASHLPLADAQTFYLAGPIYVTALSVLLLGEQVGWRRWTAVLIGFCGVVIALRPSSASFTLPALIALGGSILYALLMITTRALRDTDATILMATQFFGIFALSSFSLPFVWITPDAADMIVFAGIAFVSVVSLFCVVRALKLASAGVVIPYQYTLIVWSVTFGWLLFGEIPTVTTMVGAAVIVGAGLYIFWRERIMAKTAQLMPPE